MQEIGACEVTTAEAYDTIVENIKKNRDIGLPDISDSGWWRKDTPIAIVGGGPSLKDNLDKIRKYDFVMACGSVYDYLWENGIRATWCVVVDPDPEVMAGYLKHADGVTQYLVATQCSPSIFEYLKDFNVYTWNADGAKVEDKIDVFGENASLVGGGCTVGTRAIVLALGMGFNIQHLYGIDSCLTNDYQHHAYPFNDSEVETLGDITEIKLGGPDSPTFKVAGYMLAQIFDFKNILEEYADKLRITIYGDGALAYIMSQGNIKAKEVFPND